MTKQDFIKQFEEKVASTIRDYKLASKKDKILVAVSGGKDSTTALYVLHKLGYNVEGIIIDQLLGEYSKKNLGNIQEFCKKNEIPLHVVAMRDEYGCSVCYMKSTLDEKGFNLNSCTICGVIRRSILNKRAREFSADKIATGHNMDDEVQSFVMNLTQGDIKRSARAGPQTGIAKITKFVPRIKPLYFCTEDEIKKYSKIMKFPVVYDPCPCAADSFRTRIKKHLNTIEKQHPAAKKSIMDFFLEISPTLKSMQPEGTIRECSLCGEPSSNKVCRVCSITKNMCA